MVCAWLFKPCLKHAWKCPCIGPRAASRRFCCFITKSAPCGAECRPLAHCLWGIAFPDTHSCHISDGSKAKSASLAEGGADEGVPLENSTMRLEFSQPFLPAALPALRVQPVRSTPLVQISSAVELQLAEHKVAEFSATFTQVFSSGRQRCDLCSSDDYHLSV
jgi:hypothetical protein